MKPILYSQISVRASYHKYHDNNIVLGNRVEADEFYLSNPYHFGATIGRYAGRIGNAKFHLNDENIN